MCQRWGIDFTNLHPRVVYPIRKFVLKIPKDEYSKIEKLVTTNPTMINPTKPLMWSDNPSNEPNISQLQSCKIDSQQRGLLTINMTRMLVWDQINQVVKKALILIGNHMIDQRKLIQKVQKTLRILHIDHVSKGCI